MGLVNRGQENDTASKYYMLTTDNTIVVDLVMALSVFRSVWGFQTQQEEVIKRGREGSGFVDSKFLTTIRYLLLFYENNNKW